VIEALTKKFRVADKALVVYRGHEILGVRHADGNGWSVWNSELHRWQKATPVEAKGFEGLPLTGSIDS